MSYKFSLSTIVALVEWIEKYDKVRERQTPGQFLKENICYRKLFVEKHLEKEIFENICRYRAFIELMLKAKSLPINPHLIVHLYLMLFFMSKATSLTILESLMKTYSEEVVKDLIGLIDDEQFIVLLQENDEGNFNRDRLNEIKALTIKVKKSKLQLVAVPGVNFNRSSPFDTQSTLFRNKKVCATNSSDSSENKLEQILKKLPVKIVKKAQMLKVKNNIASILRTGAIVKNKIQSNDLVIDELVAGSNNPHKFKNQFMRFIETARIKEFQEIERKHLVGLIISEQSKLARAETAKKNQEVADEIKVQRRQLNELLKLKREQEIMRSKRIVRKTHMWRLKARKTRFELVMEKKLIADNMKKLSENAQKLLQKSKDKELQQKLEQIYKTKHIEESLKPEKAKNSNQLSFLKLKVSLAKFHKQLQDEQEARRKKIQRERERQKQLLTNAEMLIEFRYNLVREPKPNKIKLNIEPSPDLVVLRDKLAEIRKLTMKS